MVTAALASQPGKIIGLDMDRASAESHARRIREHLASAEHHLSEVRKLAWELREYKGWKALGYKSWRACVSAEFQKSASQLYRQVSAAEVENELGFALGENPERVLRPLAKKGFTPEERQALWSVAQKLVGEGGKVTTGVVEAVVTGLGEMLISGTTQDGEGEQTPLATRIEADLLARIRETKLAHKEHIRGMDAKRDYILGGLPINRIFLYEHAQITVSVDDQLLREKILAAARSGKPIYLSLWTESSKVIEG